MKRDIILSGVGGQGILSIAMVIGEAATAADINLKQAEVHGMSQRGGDVQSNLRLSDAMIRSDLIPTGYADMIISMEPMEALRYVPMLSQDACVISSSTLFKNIPDYPDEKAVIDELKASGAKLVLADIDQVAKDAGNPRGANMVLLGMAAPYIGIFTPEQLRAALCKVFARKGEAIVEANCKCFDAGVELSNK
ncbi:MAG: indolepyruvate oxidoreductase subunit beta [Bacteroidales bacterium]|nr:indolepyruvate oxidoreductase subunit beta [Bacteroidales bacterium]